jgi:hypothetical protein
MVNLKAWEKIGDFSPRKMETIMQLKNDFKHLT